MSVTAARVRLWQACHAHNDFLKVLLLADYSKLACLPMLHAKGYSLAGENSIGAHQKMAHYKKSKMSAK